jgi:serine phosphatase RsbU (regulator of sigma subunit)
MFGKKMLQEALCHHAGRPAAESVEHVLETLKRFLFPLDIQDDATLAVIKVER